MQKMLNLLPSLRIGLVLTDHKGRVISRRKEEGHSWVRNYYNIMFALGTACAGDGSDLFGAGYMTVKQEGGAIYDNNSYCVDTIYSIIPNAYSFCCSSTNDNRGIIVGTGDTAFDFDDYKLASKVLSGTGTGELSYQAMDIPVQEYDSNLVWTVTHSRNFVNQSGASITIKEVGLMVYWNVFSKSTDFLLARDVLGTPETVPDLVTLTVEYELYRDFTDIDT